MKEEEEEGDVNYSWLTVVIKRCWGLMTDRTDGSAGSQGKTRHYPSYKHIHTLMVAM